LGNLEEISSTGDYERWMKGAVGMELLSLKGFRGGGLGVGIFFTGTLEDMLRKAPYTGISLHGPLSG